MSYTVLLLSLLLIGIVCGQSTTASPAADTTSASGKASESRSTNSSDSTADEDPLKASGSTANFRFTEADAKPKSQLVQVKDDDNLGTTPDDDNDDDDEIEEEIEIVEALLDDGPKLFSDTSMNDTNTKADGDDDDSDEDGENDELSTFTLKPALRPIPEEIQIKRQGDLNPDFSQIETSNVDLSQPRQDDAVPESSPPLYISGNDQSMNSDSSSDNSPLLQLTQGGYQRPYQPRMRFNSQRQRMRTQSASQQSETIENPTRNIGNGEQSRQPQVIPQVTYSDPYQQQLGFGASLGLRNPFIPPTGFMNGVSQNGFFNTPPAGFTDFTGVNFQAPFQPNNQGFPVLQRNPSGVSLLQTSGGPVLNNPPVMIRNPQYAPAQLFSNDPSQSGPNFYQPPGFPSYSGSDNVNDASKPDYSAYFRDASPNNPSLQLNANPFSPYQDTSGGALYNPAINLPPNYPTFDDSSPFSSAYPVSNGQILIQNTAQQVPNQPQNTDSLANGGEAKDGEQINASPNKEDPMTVPFGARIRQNGAGDQNGFPAQRDIYMRYPLKEAGYATEENLPVQNTTAKTDANTDSSSRPVFPFFPDPREVRGYNGPDPYRNALNSIQQGFAINTNGPNNDDNNRTKQAQQQQSVPFPFGNSGPPRSGNPMFPVYTDRNQDTLLFQQAPFFRSPDDDVAGNPFSPVFPQTSYQPRQPIGSQSQENKIPACAKQTNSSLCFEDPDYPKRDIMYALNSNSFLIERFAIPDQQLDAIGLMDQNSSDSSNTQNNYICKSDIKYGMPLRAKDIKGKWKVIVNVDRSMAGQFVQPVRLEICSGAGEPCSFTQVKTACVQKYSIHRLLSWSPEKGVHNDVFRLPVACSCQIVDAQAS